MPDPRLEPDAGDGAVQVVDATALAQITKGEMDAQIVTAKQYPRSIEKFKQDAMSMATIDEQTAESCYYMVPRSGKTIEGPSVRLAEIVANSWGNLSAATRIIDETHSWVVAQAVCWDLERNVKMSTEVRRRITNKRGERYSDDMIGVTANAAASIALRNAIFKVVPFTYVKAVYDKCKEVAKGDIATLTEKRSRWINYWHKFGIVDEQILAALGKASVEDVGLGDVQKMVGWCNAIQEKTVQIDEIFSPNAPGGPPKGVAAVKEKIMGAEPEAKPAPAVPQSEEGVRGGAPSPAEELAAHAKTTGAPSIGELERRVVQHCRRNDFDEPPWDPPVTKAKLMGWVDCIEMDPKAQPWLE